MASIPYHTHTFDIPTASQAEIEAGVEDSKAITPDQLRPVLNNIISGLASSDLVGSLIMDTLAKVQVNDVTQYPAVTVLRYDTSSRICPTVYKKVAAQPSHAGKVQDVNGTWFEQVPDSATNRVNVLSRGALGDGSVGDSAKVIEAASIARALGAWCYAPAGSFYVSDIISNSTDKKPHLIEGDGPNQTIFKMAVSSSAGMISSSPSGAVSNVTTLSSPVARRAFVWTVVATAPGGTGSPWAANDYVCIRDKSQLNLDKSDGSTGSINGQYVQIKSVDSATQFTSWEEAEFDYAATTTEIFKINWIVGQKFRNFQIESVTSVHNSGETAFSMNTAKDTIWENISFKNMYSNNITLQRIYGGRGTNVVSYDNQITGPAVPYVWRLGFGTWNLLIDGGGQYVGRHYVTTTGNAIEIESAYCQIVNCNGSGSYIAFIDTHPADNRYFTISNNIAHSPSKVTVGLVDFQGWGIQTRGRWTTIQGNTVIGGDVGILAASGYGHRIFNNRVYGAANGISIQNCYDMIIESNDLRDINGSYGIQFRNVGTTYMPATYSMRLKDNYITGDPTTVTTETPSPGAFVINYWDDTCLWGLENSAPDASLQIVGSAAAAAKVSAYSLRSITATATLTAKAQTVLADATSGAISVNLPTAASMNGQRVTIKKTDASANAVTIDGNASETIDGATTLVLPTRWSAATIVSDGSNWFETIV